MPSPASLRLLQLLCLGAKMRTCSSSSSSLMMMMLMILLMTSSFVTRCRSGDRKIPTGLGCEFPIEWRGRYFQSSLGVLTVSQRGITTKGFCIERSRDYFLFHNRDSNCYQCLLLIRQHRNIIQYKESYCTSSATALKMVCNEIRVEAPLYTLVREPAIPMSCPFGVASSYHFDFSDLIHGFCGRPTSSAHSCSLPSRFQMHFSDCIKGTRFQGKDIELECLAIWKDGSETYLYSRLTGSGLVAKDDRYRCFKYQMYGSDVAMAMTADATCRGLRSSVDGPLIMELYKDESALPQSNCRFPDWLQGVTWRSLNGQYQYRVDADGTAIYRSEQHGPKEKSFSVFRCQSLMEKYDSRSDQFILQSLSVKNCSQFVQCLKLERISAQVIRFSEGPERDYSSLSSSSSSTSTSASSFSSSSSSSGIVNCENDKYQNLELLIPADQSSVVCPNPGVHHTTPSGGCIHRLNIGCQDEKRIAIDHSCSPGQPGLLFECFASWTEVDKVFIILKKPDSDLLDCFTFRQESGLMIFSSDANCNINWSLEQQLAPRNSLSYSIIRRETCKRNIRVTQATQRLMTTTTTTTTNDEATTRPTTHFINYDHLEESLLDYSSVSYDDVDDDANDDVVDDVIDTRTDSDDETEQPRPDTEHIDNNDDDDDDDDDDDENGVIPDDLETSSGHDSGGAIGGRRDVFEWHDDDDDDDVATRKKETLSHQAVIPRTTTMTIWRISDLSITGNSFLRETDPPTKVRISLDVARGDDNDPKIKAPPPLTRDKSRERDTVKSEEASIRHSGSTTVVFSNWRTTSTFVLFLAVVRWVCGVSGIHD